MGTAASSVGEQDEYVENERRRVENSRPSTTKSLLVGGPSKSELLKMNIENRQLNDKMKRSLRAAVLGRRSACTVIIDKNGFSVQQLQICEGQVVTFKWNETDSNLPGYNVTQVVHDGEKYRTVIGGFNSGDISPNGFYEQQFNLTGFYKFVSAGVKCTPLLIEVYERKQTEATIFDSKFEPEILRIDEGNVIEWLWTNCLTPHSIYEVKYSHRYGKFYRVNNDDEEMNNPTTRGSYKKQFNKPGLFYYQSEGGSAGDMNTCVVHVRERQREYRIEVMDDCFRPSILLIEQGDRVWWGWDKNRIKNMHCIYEIQKPTSSTNNHSRNNDENYLPKINGFKWLNPTKSGLLSHEFYEPGVYYFSDYNSTATASYIGTIIVKPKQIEHFIDVSPTNQFSPDLTHVKTGDRVWFTWKASEMPKHFLLRETEKCNTVESTRPFIEMGNNTITDDAYMDDDCEKQKAATGLDTVVLGTVGVYHYRLRNCDSVYNTCSIITDNGPRNYTIHVTDNGFEPKILNIKPNDRVWWIWQDASKILSHNIIQIAQGGDVCKNGFNSGSPIEVPSAFTHQFKNAGCFYYISENLPNTFGAIIVSMEAKVHKVEVNPKIDRFIENDPVIANINDVVAWTYNGLQHTDVSLITSLHQLENESSADLGEAVIPRRCLNRMFNQKGMYHFTSKTFYNKKPKNLQLSQNRMSTVLVDDLSDNCVIRVERSGFHPSKITIRKGQSILWTWRDSDEEHNITRVSLPTSDEPLSEVKGTKSFSSGKQTPNNSFLYTFDEIGQFCVASRGAPGYDCTIEVVDANASKAVSLPYIVNGVNGGLVRKNHIVKLKCDTKDAKIYYTIDGTAPELHKLTAKVTEIEHATCGLLGMPKEYNPKKGIVLRTSGICYVRALAVVEKMLNSPIYTSKRFWVKFDGKEDENETVTASETEDLKDTSDEQEVVMHWQNCAPTIKAYLLAPGVLEVLWDPPAQESMEHISHYKLLLNNISFGGPLTPKTISAIAAGLAGGRVYEVVLETYPKNHTFLPHRSNKLIMKSNKLTENGGPVISLEITENPKSIAVVWKTISTESRPIQYYILYLNNQKCGSEITPDPDSDRCKVVIDGCQLENLYKIIVSAVDDENRVRHSNELDIRLPLNIKNIDLPEENARNFDDDLYNEYVEIQDTDVSVENRIISTPKAINTIMEDENFGNDNDDVEQIEKDASEYEEKESVFGAAEKIVEKIENKLSDIRQELIEQNRDDCVFEIYDDEEETIESENEEIYSERTSQFSSEHENLTEDECDQMESYFQESNVSFQSKNQVDQEEHNEVKRINDEEEKISRCSTSSTINSSKKRRKSNIDNANAVFNLKPYDTHNVVPLSNIGSYEAYQKPISLGKKITWKGAGNLIKTVNMFKLSKKQPEKEIVHPWKNKIKSCNIHSKSSSSESTPPTVIETNTFQPSIKIMEKDGSFTYKDEPEFEVDVGIFNDTESNRSVVMSHENEIVGRVKQKKKVKRRVQVEVDSDSNDERQKTLTNGLPMQTITLPLSITPGSDGLPTPNVTASNKGKDTVVVNWSLPYEPDPKFRLLVYVVHILGPNFQKEVNSSISYECMIEDGDDIYPGIHHQWNVPFGDNKCEIYGLIAGKEYRIYVSARYNLVSSTQSAEMEVKSKVLRYTTLGKPSPPILRIVSSDICQVNVAWAESNSHKDVGILGYNILIDGEPIGKQLTNNTKQSIIENLRPGTTVRVSVVAISSKEYGQSEKSNQLLIHCPFKPPPVDIEQQPSFKSGTAIIGWKKPIFNFENRYEDIQFYKIFLDGQNVGQVAANKTNNKSGYQYHLTDLEPGTTYEISVKAYAGQTKPESNNANEIYCLIDSDDRYKIDVRCSAPPESPQLKILGMATDGIDIGWTMPQQYGDATVSGFQLLKNDRFYGAIIPADVSSLKITDGLNLGDKISLQLLALTDHPCGRDQPRMENSSINLSKITENEAGLLELYIDGRYSACKPGPKLDLVYTGLVKTPEKVWAEKVTGHSALICWKVNKKFKQHFIDAEYYQVTWWPGNSSDQVRSQTTSDDRMVLDGLKPHLKYTVVVESRHTVDSKNNSYILIGKSEPLTIVSASPPAAVSNLGEIGTTNSAIKLAWDPLKNSEVDIISLRVDAVPMKNTEPQQRHVCVELVPDATSAIIENLMEKTEYLLTVTAITEEYYESLPEGDSIRKNKSLPIDKPPPEDNWLPSTSIISTTSGTDAPHSLQVVKKTSSSITLTWKPAVAYGSCRLQGTLLRYAENRKVSNNGDEMANNTDMQVQSNTAIIDNLLPGIEYKIVVEAIVSIKTAVSISSISNPESEKMDRRTVHVMSKPIVARTAAPCLPPQVYITGYTSDRVHLAWQKPVLCSNVGKDENGNQKYIKLNLDCYRLEINGKPHMRLSPNSKTCTLVQCKPSKTYKIVLIAMTCTSQVHKQRKGELQRQNIDRNVKWQPNIYDNDNDESASKPVTATIPNEQIGLLADCNVEYAMSPENGLIGDVKINWSVQGNTANLEHFEIAWKDSDGSKRKKNVQPDCRQTTIPANKQNSIQDLKVIPIFSNSTVNNNNNDSNNQQVQCLIPGPPEAPEIFCKSVQSEQFIIEWAEPKLWGVKIKSYQLYLNGKRIGNELNPNYRKAIVPCANDRLYKVQLKALSCNDLINDSKLSNVLEITPSSNKVRSFYGTVTPIVSDNEEDPNCNFIPVRVMKVTDTTIHLDWGYYKEPTNLESYKLIWSSTGDPVEKQVALKKGENSCTIHKCYPGNNHNIVLYGLNHLQNSIDQSRKLNVQTSAPPDTPTVSLRAINFKYITIEWKVPRIYGDAKIQSYKIFVNGIVEDIISSDQTTYSFTRGRWCCEYAFQVQAITGSDRLDSRPSDPLLVVWPGVQPPVLQRSTALGKGNVRVVWNVPPKTDSITIKQYKLVCRDLQTGNITQIISPIHPDTTEAEIQNLKKSVYEVFLEVHVHGTQDVVRSESLQIIPEITPDPPHIDVNVIGVEERRQIEKVTCDLINKRDRLLNLIANNNNEEEDYNFKKATEELAEIEAMLDDCLNSLKRYTGQFLANVSWTPQQTDDDIKVIAYKILVDGKQYGKDISIDQDRDIRIRLKADRPSYKISMVSVGQKNIIGGQSNVVEILTDTFEAFNFWKFFQHNKGSYIENLAAERRLSPSNNNNYNFINTIGLGKRHAKSATPPSCNVLDLFECEYRTFLPPSGPRLPTAILFWSKSNPYSIRYLNWFVKYAKKNAVKYRFIAVSTIDKDFTETIRQKLIHIITHNGWRDDQIVRHVTSVTSDSLSSGKKTFQKGGIIHHHFNLHDPNCKFPHKEKNETGDVANKFGVIGTPSIVIVHPDDYIAWKGRYCAYDYQVFDSFMTFVLREATNQHTDSDPWNKEIDRDLLLDTETFKETTHTNRGGVGTSSFQNRTNTATIIHAPTLNNNQQRPHSNRRLFRKSLKQKSNNRISIENRPFSAKNLSPPNKKLFEPYQRQQQQLTTTTTSTGEKIIRKKKKKPKSIY